MINNLRIISGLILFVFVLGHFINHALGIISLKAMNDALSYSIAPWRTYTGTILLLSALITHAVLALWSLYQRRSYRLKTWEYLQIILGFFIPIFLAAHVLSTRGIYEVFGIEKAYGFQLYALWVASPYYGILLAVGLLTVWTHACIGWHYWLRLKPWYQYIQMLAFAFAILVPALAAAGYVSAGLSVTRLAQNQSWVERLDRNIDTDRQIILNFISDYEVATQLTVISLVILIVGFNIFRRVMSRRGNKEKLNYRSLNLKNKQQVNLRQGISVLDHLRSANIPHASVCGGKGRCSTCRVRIDVGLENLPPPSLEESKVLSRIAAAPNVRLACQLKPDKGLDITAILSPDVGANTGYATYSGEDGQELQIAILFADIRAFTKLSEAKLPYDVSFLLNRYFAAMGDAIEQTGGHLDKFIGDGVMALFGLNKSIERGCADAIRATQKMAEKLEELNDALAGDLDEPLRIGIGVHTGTAIVGKMGYKRTSSLTAIGDVVNTASRLENATKELGVQTIISEKTVLYSGMTLPHAEQHEVTVRGREQPIKVYAVSA
ncbi:adenylate/guanylate cyclase domain-containing protein [Roseovarius rhodophyticola]|uniref:Adenylate/guanylate cyclase domain-containing protein n=1 Tax=Roseovarius rhodophyticola TaxID=3080827 RepID=A0ABZ2TFP5_9RHOB|nr:adenylate/guanylate cyclase domain-containing protein [Roseovarius sp. W115]MDV2928817.1 adenylate/guanylate cyclase domain-containing protein [Roseovarius sp. W115]